MEVERGDCYSAACPAREVLGHVTGRWGGLVLGALTHGTRRYSEIRARIEGISEKMLAQTLRDLERDGLLLRTSRPVVPPYVDYRLTPMGVGVAEHIEGLVRWIEAHARDFMSAQREHDASL